MTSASRTRIGARGTPATATPLQKAADQSGLLSDADRETLQVEGPAGERHIVADRLISMNGLISLLLLLYSAWALRYPDRARRGWQAAQEWSMRGPLGRAGRGGW